jgi:hypothetical protein
MTNRRVPRSPGEHSPKPLFDLRLLVLAGAAGLIVWLGLTRPAAATAVGLGVTVLYMLHRLVGR